MITRDEMVRTLVKFCKKHNGCNGCLLGNFSDGLFCDFDRWSDNKLTLAYNHVCKNGEVRLDGSHIDTTPHVKLPKEATESSNKSDMVSHPKHYTQGGIECIDALKAATVGKHGIEAVCVANVIKYLWRYEEKNGAEDVRKARWYIERLLKEMGEE